MILLAIDPGYRESHAVLYSPGGWISSPRAVRRCWSLPNDDMLDFLRVRSGLHERVLIESMDPFGLRLGRETMDTILWIGRFMEAGRAELVPRSLIKMTLCGTRRADDASIRRVLVDRLGAPGSKKQPGPTYGVSGHLWQALAVAVTWVEVRGFQQNPTEPPPADQPALFEEER